MSDVQTKPDAAQQLLCLRDKLLNDTDFVKVIRDCLGRLRSDRAGRH